MPSIPWTDEEREVVRAHYQAEGGPWCAARTGRSLKAVWRQARALGVARAAVDLRQTSNPFIDAAIRRAYEGGHAKPVRALATTIGRAPQWISARAAELGLTLRRPDLRPYGADEYRFVRDHAQLTAASLAIAMRRHGWRRTPASIRQLILREGFCRTPEHDGSNTASVALCFGVAPSTVQGWIRAGLLTATRCASAMGNGLAYRIEDEAIARFVVRHPGHVDQRKVDFVWLVDLLARLGAGADLDEEGKGRRILALAQARPDLGRRQIAEIVGTTADTVSTVRSRARRAERERSVA